MSNTSAYFICIRTNYPLICTVYEYNGLLRENHRFRFVSFAFHCAIEYLIKLFSIFQKMEMKTVRRDAIIVLRGEEIDSGRSESDDIFCKWKNFTFFCYTSSRELYSAPAVSSFSTPKTHLVFFRSHRHHRQSNKITQ